MGKPQFTSLLDLPVLPTSRDSAIGEHIITAYVTERRALKKPSELRPFIKRWRNLWLLRPGPVVVGAHPGSWLVMANEPLRAEVLLLLNGDFDAKRVYKFLDPNCELTFDGNKRDCAVAGHLGIPSPMLWAERLASYYGVMTDLAMVRLYLDSYPQHMDALR